MPVRAAPALAALLLLPACHEPSSPPVRVVSAAEVYTLEQAATIQGRDGGQSARIWGRSLWAYGDTVLDVPDASGVTWHHNAFSYTDDLVAEGGITGFAERLDTAGAPVHFIAPTAEEEAFNVAHRGDACAAPCNARWAAWPGAPLYDDQRDRGLIFYSLIYAEPGDMSFRSVGQGIAVWDRFEDAPRRPEVSPGAAHPTLLFDEGEPTFGVGATIDGTHLYALACDVDSMRCPCLLGRAPLADVLVRGAWEYWDGQAWSTRLGDAASVFDGSPIVSLAWNAYLGLFTAVYSELVSNHVALRTAPALNGPWSDPLRLFTGDRRTDEGWIYDAIQHPEYAEDGGQVIWITHSRPTGVGWFGAELAVWRVELEALAAP
jgi:hypothetical protein